MATRGKMVQQAVLVADQKVTDVDYRIDASQIGPDGLMLRKGKKTIAARFSNEPERL